MEPDYFLVINGKPEGPFSIQQLREFKIKPGDFVKTAQMPDYKEAHEVAELREALGFTQETIIPQYFGNFDQRLMAAALDWFFVSGICILISLLFILSGINSLEVGISLVGIIPIVNFIYHVVMESSAKQGTYGKQILKIKVCDLLGRRISFLHAAGRNLARFFCTITLYTGYLLSFFNKRQQCLHDMIAGTLVVKDRLF